MDPQMTRTFNFSQYFVFSYACILLLYAESDEADKLEELKKVTAEENARSNKRRMKFQAQDSVLVSSFGGSVDE